MVTPSLCSICGRPVDLDRTGRRRRLHPECRPIWRSQHMQGNNIRAGKYTTRPCQAPPADPLKTDAYRGLDAAVIRRVGLAYWGELADFAYWSYDILNPLCFGGRIRHPLFQFCRVMPYGACIGLSCTEDLDRPVIEVFLSLWTRRDDRHLAVFGVIAHEMMHFDAVTHWREAGGGRMRTSHNNEFWLSGVERVSPTIGVDLGRLNKPFGHWPLGGWPAGEAKELNAMLSDRQFSL